MTQPSVGMTSSPRRDRARRTPRCPLLPLLVPADELPASERAQACGVVVEREVGWEGRRWPWEVGRLLWVQPVHMEEDIATMSTWGSLEMGRTGASSLVRCCRSLGLVGSCCADLPLPPPPRLRTLSRRRRLLQTNSTAASPCLTVHHPSLRRRSRSRRRLLRRRPTDLVALSARVSAVPPLLTSTAEPAWALPSGRRRVLRPPSAAGVSATTAVPAPRAARVRRVLGCPSSRGRRDHGRLGLGCVHI